MSTDYTKLQTQYLLNSKLTSYESSDLPIMMYLNQPSTVRSQSELLAGNSLPRDDYVGALSAQSKEVIHFAPCGQHIVLEPNGRQVDGATDFSDCDVSSLERKVFAKRLLHEQNADLNLQHQQGLSLSLGNQVPSSIQMASYHDAYTHSGGSSLLSSHVEHNTEDYHSRSNALQKAEDFSFDLATCISNRLNVGSLCAFSNSPKEMNSGVKLQEDIVVGGMIFHSKYLKVVHELLDEFVNTHQHMKQNKKHHDFQSFCHDVSKSKFNCQPGMLLDSQKLASNSSNELSPTLQNDLNNKMTKLLSFLDEVDGKYHQYYQEMQCVESSFEIVAGLGAARRYTGLALWTISRQFSCLRNAIEWQIQVVQKTLGEQGTVSNLQGAGLTRLRYIDHQLRQQRALQQFGMVRQPWRPQRGLPETAVSILRAWLFEHFLHPYPKDSEKIMLARQTGLSRSQVANWFINARVRLWKPMIEEMYKEEFGNMGVDIQSSQESEQPGVKLKSSESTGEELHESFTFKATDGGQHVKSNKFGNDIDSKIEGNAYMESLGIKNNFQEDEEMAFESNKSHRDQRVNASDQSNQNNNGSIAAVSDAFSLSMLGAEVSSKVSLALGLQHSENETSPIFGGTQSRMGDTVAASVSSGLDTADCFFLDPSSQHDRFSHSHILSDYVV